MGHRQLQKLIVSGRGLLPVSFSYLLDNHFQVRMISKSGKAYHIHNDTFSIHLSFAHLLPSFSPDYFYCIVAPIMRSFYVMRLPPAATNRSKASVTPVSAEPVGTRAMRIPITASWDAWQVRRTCLPSGSKLFIGDCDVTVCVWAGDWRQENWQVYSVVTNYAGLYANSQT